MSSAAPEPRTRAEGAELRVLVPLRPQGPIEVIDRATHLVRARFADVMTVSLAVQLPIWLLLAVILRERWAGGVADDGGAQYWATIFPGPSLLAVAGTDGWGTALAARALPSLGLAVMGGAYGTLVHDWSRGRATTGGQALRRAGRHLPSLAGLWAIIHVLEVATCVGVVLGPLVFGVAAPLCAMEGLGPLRGLQRSWSLSLKRFWSLCLTIPVATFVGVVTAIVVGGLGLSALGLLVGDWVDTGGVASVALANALPHLVLDPILALSMALIALDLKVQAEGYDLEVDLADAERRGAGA